MTVFDPVKREDIVRKEASKLYVILRSSSEPRSREKLLFGNHYSLEALLKKQLVHWYQ